MTEKKQDKASADKRPELVATIRDGAVAANIFVGQTQDGFEYHYFLLSRSWKSTKAGREGYSERFFAQNAAAIANVAAAAAEKCEERNRGLSQPDHKAA